MELGSEFDLDLSQLTETSDTIFTYLEDFQAIYTDSGRSSLRLLSGLLQGEAILLPDYICGTVADALPEDCRIIYYPVNLRFQINMEKLEELLHSHSVRFLYLMHYFGSLQQKNVIAHIAYLKQEYHLTIIEDTTHSLFTAKKTIGDYIVASLRKWFPIPDGGVLYAEKGHFLSEPPLTKKPASQKVEAMLLKKLYLTEGFDCNAKYREIFTKEEAAFQHQTGVYQMSDIAHFLLAHFPIAPMCHSRQRNAALLLEGLRGMQRIRGDCSIQCIRKGSSIQSIEEGYSMQCRSKKRGMQCKAEGQNMQCESEILQHSYGIAVNLKPAEVPLALPIYAAQRDMLRSLLIKRNVYCAVHWPLGHPAAYGDSRWIGEHILSLPLDQRYQKEDMEYLLDCLAASKKEMEL